MPTVAETATAAAMAGSEDSVGQCLTGRLPRDSLARLRQWRGTVSFFLAPGVSRQIEDFYFVPPGRSFGRRDGGAAFRNSCCWSSERLRGATSTTT